MVAPRRNSGLIRCLVGIAALACVLGSSPAAFAGKAEKKAAKKLLKKGSKALKGRKFGAAAATLKKSWALHPAPKTLKALVTAYVGLDDVGSAAVICESVVKARKPKKAVKFAKKWLSANAGKIDAVRKAAALKEQEAEAARKKSAAADAAAAKAREQQLSASKKAAADGDQKRAVAEAQREAAENRKDAIAYIRLEADEAAAPWNTAGWTAMAFAGLGVATAGVFQAQAFSEASAASACAATPAPGGGTCTRAVYDLHKDNTSGATLNARLAGGAATLLAGVALGLWAAGAPDYEAIERQFDEDQKALDKQTPAELSLVPTPMGVALVGLF